MDFAEKMHKCSEYVEALEVERRKIQVFRRELPLCLELVSQAIDACRQQLSTAAAAGTSRECFHVRRQQRSECSEQTSCHGPVLEEFIPIKRAASCSSECEEEEDESSQKSGDKPAGKKSDWLRSVQLWNQSSDPAPASEVKKNVGAFRPFNKESKAVVAAAEMAERQPVEDKPASSTTLKSRNEESGQATQRKQRRCWSPELHRRFIHALQQLGGPHVASPKQIKELMKVDGLTNDEVKSHLQKYRLHMRRPGAAAPSSAIWVAPPDSAAPALEPAATTSSSDQPEANNSKKEARVYAPVSTVGTPYAQPATQTSDQKVRSGSHCEEDDNGSHSTHGGAGAHCRSPASSSSTHTTATASPMPSS
uniref:HTH myb-type domain-containing protein n=1 Tax=Kalanchoe fedtschenkoi TaxID=63787 RepID=A0A7N1A3J3_KALFE